MDSAFKRKLIENVVKLLEGIEVRSYSIKHGIDEQPPVDFFRRFERNDTITIDINGGALDRKIP